MSVGDSIILRRLPNWIDSWVEYSDVLSSPRIFRKWTAIGLIAAAMERRMWVVTKGTPLYPNLYVTLVGPPGVGKSAILSHAERILRSLTDHFIAPNSVSAASLVDSLVLANRKIIRPNDNPSFVQFNYLTVIASELGVFLPMYDPLFMNSLTKFYDGEHYEERRRTGKVNFTKLEHAHLTILAGTTPSYLNGFLPEGAWDQGYTARTIFVFSAEKSETEVFQEEDTFRKLESLYLSLVNDIKSIGNVYGKFEWTEEAKVAVTAWARMDCPPIPDHGKLTHYNTRRLAQVLKLCMVASIARNNELLITVEDYQTALGWLLEVEIFMPDIFHSMGGVAGDSKAIEDTWYYIYKLYAKEKKPILQGRVIGFLKDRVPSYSIMKVIEVMERSGMIKLDLSLGTPAYLPGQKS